MQLHPLLFEPIYKEKVWGGRSLERFGRELPGGPDTLIGESWELADLASTAPSGGGGEAARSVVANGDMEGMKLDELVRDHADAVLGSVTPTEEEGFPLLIKYLDARENLSVQVHPSIAYAAEHEDAHLKSEAWYVVDAEPGAVIYKGVKDGTTPERLRAAIEGDSVRDLLVEVPVEPGDCHYLPSGTCHALGAGILLAEVQTPSDTTFRLYDWGRTDRELHVDAALECIEYGPARTEEFEPGTLIREEGREVRSLVHCDHFAIDEWRAEPLRRIPVERGRPEVWMVVEGRADLRSPPDAFDPVVASPGRTLLVPAALPPAVLEVIEPLVMLRVTLPAA